MKLIKYFILSFFIITFSYAKKESVSLQLQWKHQFQFAGYYMAKEKGFYDDLNLNVKILEYKRGRNTLNNVLSGKVTYATGRISLINQRSKDKKITLLASILQSSPLALVSKQSSLLTKISDFKNKKLTLTGNEAESAIFPLLLSQNITKKDIKIIKSAHKLRDFINNKTDIITLYTSNQELTLKQRDIKYNIFHPKDHGFDFYDDILYTSENETIMHKQRVVNFTNASLKGWQYAFDHIEETVNLILLKYNTQNKTKEELLYEANVLKKLALKNDIPMGNINKNKIQRIYDIYNVMGLTQNPIDMESFIFTIPTKTENSHNKKATIFNEEEIKYLQNNKIITMCNNPTWEPIEFAENGDTKQMAGISIDTLKQIEKNLNIKFQNVPTSSWTQSQQFLKEKKCDILPSAIKTKKRELYSNFTDPYLHLPLAIFTAKNRPLVNGISEIIDKSWSRQKGSGLIHKMEIEYPNNKLVVTNTTNEAFQFVNNGTTYFTIATLPVASNLISKYRLDNLQIAGYSNIIYKLSIAVRKDKVVLRNILDKELKSISKSMHRKILKEWISNTEKPYFDTATIRNVLIVVFVCVILLFYRQYLLKKTNANLKYLVDKKTKELKELNQNLEVRIEKAIDQNREKDKILHAQAKMVSMGEMIGNIAHQWRQPLSVISTGVTGMQVQKEFGLLNDQNFEQTCKVINNNAQYLSRTIDDFKNFIKGDRIKHPFLLQNNLDTFINLVEGSIKKENIELILDIEKNLQIDGYENELVQCFINIFNNAKDVLQSTRTKNKIIIISAKKEKNTVLIDIQDNAKGIDEAIVHKIFEPYFTTKHKYQGTGLGLNMTYKLIVEGMNGNITVSNNAFTYNDTEHYGAKFHITLPVT